MPQDLVRVAAIEWWRMKKPMSFSFEDHLANPTVNCVAEQEKALAQAVADYLDE